MACASVQLFFASRCHDIPLSARDFDLRARPPPITHRATSNGSTYFVGEYCLQDTNGSCFSQASHEQELRPGARLKLGAGGVSVGVCPWLRWDPKRQSWLQPRGASRQTNPGGTLTGCEALARQMFCMARRGEALYDLLGGAQLAAQVGGSWGSHKADQDLDVAFFRKSSNLVPHPTGCNSETASACEPAWLQNWEWKTESDVRFMAHRLCLCQYSGQLALCRTSAPRNHQVDGGMSWWVRLPGSKGMGYYQEYAKKGSSIAGGWSLDGTLADLARFGQGTEQVGLSHFLDVVWKEADAEWLEVTLQTEPCVVMNAYREIRAAYFFLKKVEALTDDELEYNERHWPRTKPPLPNPDKYGLALQPKCLILLAKADKPSRRVRYFDYRWDFDSPRRENVDVKRRRFEGRNETQADAEMWRADEKYVHDKTQRWLDRWEGGGE